MIQPRQCKRGDLPVRWQALCVLWFCCVTAPALAVTLGQESVLSLLGDPIEVEIEVLHWEDVDLDRVQLSLASPTEYDSFRLSSLPVLEQLNFNLIGPNPRGEVKVLVSTREPVSEPYVELLLVLRWPGGSLLREYVLLFDLPLNKEPGAGVVHSEEPRGHRVLVDSAGSGSTVGPERNEARGAPTEASGATSFTPVSEAPVVQRIAPASVGEEPDPPVLGVPDSEPATAQPQEIPEPRNQGAIMVGATTAPVPLPATGRRTYQVREGDGLWSIAQQFQPAGVGENIYQMLLSLHDLNRAAFINDNISLLKANTLLQIPDVADIIAVDPASAEARFAQRWAEGTRRLQSALRGDPIRESSDLHESAAVEDDPMAGIETRVPGEESGRVLPGGSGLLSPATTPVVVPPAEAGPASSGDLLVGEQGLQGAATAQRKAEQAVTTGMNPYLQRIDASTRDLTTLLQSRSMQVASLERQLLEMRQRMREAQQLTSRLNQALEQALLRRNEQSSATARSITLLGMLAFLLLLALLAAMAMLFRLTAQLSSQRRWLAGDAQPPASLSKSKALRSARAVKTMGELPASSAIVVEATVEMPGMSDRNQDAGLEEELLEILGPALRDTPGPKSGEEKAV